MPILQLPQPIRQLVEEVDASRTGVGAVLSQRSPFNNKLYHCAFFSHKLFPVERNYDVEDEKLLAIKSALEE